MGVERIIEILKGTIPPLAKEREDTRWENVRRAILQFLAFGCGSVIAYMAKDQIGTMPGVPSNMKFDGSGCALLGLLASGGSAFWNHALDIARATKVSSENVAKAAGGKG